MCIEIGRVSSPSLPDLFNCIDEAASAGDRDNRYIVESADRSDKPRPVAKARDHEADQHPRVFITYSHDSPAHIANVISLAQDLRDCGIDAWIDEFEQPPPLNWPQWMIDQIRDADYVLVVCTETYLRRFEQKEEPDTGRGVTWEGTIITAEQYQGVEREMNHQKFIPVLVSEEDARYIPIQISSRSRYIIGTEGDRDLDDLLRHLTNQPRVIPNPLGPIPHLPPIGELGHPGPTSEDVKERRGE